MWRTPYDASRTDVDSPTRLPPITSTGTSSSATEALRDDHIHRDVMGLRIDGRQLGIREGDADGVRARGRGREGAIKKAAAIPQPIAPGVESDQRHHQDIRADEVTLR